MARVRPIRRIRSLQLNKFRQVGTDINGRPKLEVYFKSRDGSNYVWTPVLHEGTLKLFQIVCQINPAEQQSNQTDLENTKSATDYLALAIKIGKALYEKTSLDHVRKVAKSIFTFDLAPPVHFTMPDIVAQEIYDWIITLSEQPIDDEEKLKLIRKFVKYINSATSSEKYPVKS
jgi:hypothetical protein